MKDFPDQIPLDFGMVRVPDHTTSIDAAKGLLTKLTKLHNEVISAFAQLGELTDSELEQLPQFESYGPSTIRKRRSELYQAGRLVDTGKTKENERGKSMIVWKLP